MSVVISFSNSTSLTLHENDVLIPVQHSIDNNRFFFGDPWKLWYHASYGFIPPLIEFLGSCEYFLISGNNSIAYRSSSIVSIEGI